ncbi:MAG: glycoside hydrolase family 43 protein [Clostridia bacterium]
MKYQNPIIRGFNPDPSICRVDNDFYLVTSTFEYFPGIPVYHSTDLVNWTQIGNCIERPEQLPFEIALPDKGIWAPTIRYNKGKFYVTAKFMNYGNFIVSSENPATGWSDPIKVDIDGIDPSILFDNGKTYYCTNQRGGDGKEAISLAQIDIETGELLSDVKAIWNGASKNRPQYLESPHIYHIGDWYYLFAAEGGTGYEHMITAARSRNIWGPYEDCENNPLLTNRNSPGGDVACSGHGDLIDDMNGNWWVVHLATRPDDEWYSHMGRETFLLPVTWKNELPYIADGISHIEYDAPLLKEQKPIGKWQADFNSIEPQWLFLRKPDMENYILNDGHLILKPSIVKISDETGSPTFIAQRQKDIDCTVEAKIDFEPINDGDEAGIAIYISNNGYYSFCKKRKNGKSYVIIYKNDNVFEPIMIETNSKNMTFRIEASKKNYEFYYSVTDGEYAKAGNVSVLSRADAGKCFTGTLIGLYAQCATATQATAEVHSFHIE